MYLYRHTSTPSLVHSGYGRLVNRIRLLLTTSDTETDSMPCTPTSRVSFVLRCKSQQTSLNLLSSILFIILVGRNIQPSRLTFEVSMSWNIFTTLMKSPSRSSKVAFGLTLTPPKVKVSRIFCGAAIDRLLTGTDLISGRRALFFRGLGDGCNISASSCRFLECWNFASSKASSRSITTGGKPVVWFLAESAWSWDGSDSPRKVFKDASLVEYGVWGNSYFVEWRLCANGAEGKRIVCRDLSYAELIRCRRVGEGVPGLP